MGDPRRDQHGLRKGGRYATTLMLEQAPAVIMVPVL